VLDEAEAAEEPIVELDASEGEETENDTPRRKLTKKLRRRLPAVVVPRSNSSLPSGAGCG